MAMTHFTTHALLVSDYDHSLLAKPKKGWLNEEQATEANLRTAATLSRFQAEGGIVALCSGGSFARIAASCQEIGFAPDFISSACGTMLHSFADGVWTEEEAYSAQMRNAFNVDDIIWASIAFAASRKHIGIPHRSSKGGKASFWVGLSVEDEDFPILLEQHLHQQGLVRGVLETSWSDIKEQWQIELFEKLGFAEEMVKNVDNLAASKGYALDFLIKLLSPARTLVMGDSGNDKTLFFPVQGLEDVQQPTCILPGNADAQLRGYADMNRTFASRHPCGDAFSDFLGWLS
jgi:hydroxymethylpyrimidine pyrophosphatase-like HAD family hydrolase